MDESMRMGIAAWATCVVLCLCGWAAAASAAGPLVFDKETGHYKDLSYEALSDDGLSWEQRTRLFGGETVHYGKLTDQQRKAKEKQLQELLAKIDMKLVNRCEADIRAWLDERAARVLKHKDWKQDWSTYTRRSMWHLIFGSVTLFRAYEIFGDEEYLKAGLKRADVFLAAQDPRGNWRGNICRIQDKFQDGPFYVMLYAHKVSGDKKYFESAKRCADILLPLQRSSGGWPDQWCFDGARAVNSGIINGMSHNDSATVSPFTMMVMMYHLTKDRKYVANLHKLGPFIAKTDLGEGKPVGWAGGYDDNGRPLRVRQYEIEVIQPSFLPRSVGPLLIWLYLMEGNEAHMDVLRKGYAWHETVRRKEMEPWQLEAWEAMSKAYADPTWGRLYYRPGWPDGILPDGSNWGRCLYFKILPWYPVTAEMKKKYGHKIHSSQTDAGSRPGKIGYLSDWAKVARSGGKIPLDRMGGLNHSSRGNTMVQVRRALLEHKRGGHKGLLKYYTGSVKYTPDQYLQARVDAAKRALDARNVRLAAMHEKGIRSLADSTALVALKGRWYGPKHTKWGGAYDDRILHPQHAGSTAWYQWQLVYDTMIARGKIDADAAARGGRGMEAWVSSMSHLDSWDVLGQYDMKALEVENYFDVPIAKTSASAATAEEMYVIRDGKLNKEALDWTNTGPENKAFSKHWVHCAGKTVDGLYVVPKQVANRQNHARFIAAKSALGDCEFKVVFACPDGRGTAMPIVHIRDRGRLLFARDGSQIWMSLRKQSLPLKSFAARCEKNPYDGKLHSMGVKRVGGKISFYYDDKQINEQPIDPDTNLHLWFDALRVSPKIKSMKLTAEKLSDNLTTTFRSAAPIEVIFDGTGAALKAEHGKACRYRIPALAISTKGTILAFAEARRTGGGDIGNIDAVVKRSEDNGKTWGPEIVIWDAGGHSINNPSAVVDPKTGRIWVFMGRWDGNAPSQHVAYSDDDGKTWSKSKDMTQILRKQIKDGRRLIIPGPGSGVALTREKYAGRLIIPMNHGAAWGPSVVYSDDSGKTWKVGGALHANVGESKCAELCDGSVLFVGNPGPPETRRRLTVITEGGTRNATKMRHAEDLKHVGCQGAVERHSWPKGDKPGLLLYSGPGAATARAQGTLRGSYDDGKTWPWKLEYYQGPSGYSDVAALPDGRVIVLFEKDGKSDLGFTILRVPPTEPPAKPGN